MLKKPAQAVIAGSSTGGMGRILATFLFALLATASLNSCIDRPAVMPAPRDMPGLHNVLRFANGVFSGSMPEGDVGFDSLERLGIESVVSVDGIRPDLGRAESRGIRYVHVPIQYSGIDSAAQVALAKAIRDLPRQRREARQSGLGGCLDTRCDRYNRRTHAVLGKPRRCSRGAVSPAPALGSAGQES